jgi:hypothetical protein
MSAQTQTLFDFDLLKRSFETWDLETLSTLYHEDIEQIVRRRATSEDH